MSIVIQDREPDLEINKPSVDAAVDLITLNRKVQVGRLPAHQAFRIEANMHNSSQICHPEVIN